MKIFSLVSILLVSSLTYAAKPRGYGQNLLDYGLTPFCDRASHGVLLRPEVERQPVAAWTLRSAWALGTDSKLPSPAKNLFSLKLGLNVIGANGKPETVEWELSQAEDCPRWTLEQWTSRDKKRPFQAEVVTLFPETDCVLLLATFKNATFQKARVSPFLAAGQDLPLADYLGKHESGAGVFTLKADRSRLFSRKVVETVVLVAGGAKGLADFKGPGAPKEPMLDNTERLVSGAFSLTLSAAAVDLKPGASARFPVLISFDPDATTARGRIRDAWKKWALPVGAAFTDARQRTVKTMGNLPQPLEKAFKDASQRACWALLASEYARRGELTFPLFSAAKGFRDAFFSLETPLAALGYSELDWGKSEDALLQLSSFAAAAALPIPPYTGEGLLFWEAGGFPMTGWAAWDLYLRDFDRQRARDYLGAWGPRFNHECQWWESRTGDAFGYAVKNEEPWAPSRLRLASLTQTAGENSDVGLTAMAAWQLQAGAALQQAQGNTPMAARLQERADQVAAGLLRLGWDADNGCYHGGLNGFLPFMLGVDRDAGRARRAIEGRLLSETYFPKDDERLPFAESGVMVPWKAYMAVKTLCLYGYHARAQEAVKRILAILSRPKALFGAYDKSGAPLEIPGDAATAAAVLEMSLGRQELEAYLLPDTKAVSGRIRKLRTPDGGFELEMLQSAPKGIQGELSAAAPKGGAILKEGAFIFSASKPGKLSFVSLRPVDVLEMKNERDLFKGTRSGSLLVKAQVRYLFKFQQPQGTQ